MMTGSFVVHDPETNLVIDCVAHLSAPDLVYNEGVSALMKVMSYRCERGSLFRPL